MFADEIRRQAEAAPRAALPAVTAALWLAYTEGRVTEAEAEDLSALIEIRLTAVTNLGAPIQNRGVQSRNTPADRAGSPKRPGAGSRPRTDASMQRRRRWAASGRLPPGIASKFTLAEQAVLSLVAAETARRGDCRLAHEHVAALCGVSRSTVKSAMREARQLGLITVEERPVTAFRNLPNIVRIVSREWTVWLRLARKALPSWQHLSTAEGGGVKSATGTHTQVLRSGKTSPAETAQGGFARSIWPSRLAMRIANA